MRRGTAFHKALELARDGEAEEVSALGYTFRFNGDFEIALPDTREMRLTKDYGGIRVSGQVDAWHGATIIDHKTTDYFDGERYQRGYQWRYYLDIFGATLFRWHIFVVKEVEPCYYEVNDLHVMEQYRYPGLGTDCLDLAHKLRDFVNEHSQELAGAAYGGVTA